MSAPESPQYRAELDFEIIFANGGSLRGESFRIDVDRPDLADDELASALIRDLGLLMVDELRIDRREVFPEPHKRPPASAATSASARLRHADLSHVITEGMVTIPGFPVPRVQAQSVSARLPPGRYAPGVSFAIGEISLCGNTSTYLDSPRHLLPAGTDLAGLDLDRLAGLEGLVIDVTGMAETGRRSIKAELLTPYDVAGRAVLLRTGWDARWGTDAYHAGYPFLTRWAAVFLAGKGAALVGIDAPNVDDTDDPARPAHSVLLEAGVPICEHLTGLDALPGAGFRFTAVPPKVGGFGTFPVRAFATWPA